MVNKPRRVLRQASVAHLGEAPQALHHVEGMLAASPGGRAQAVELAAGTRLSGRPGLGRRLTR